MSDMFHDVRGAAMSGLRVTGATLAICVAGYALAIFGLAQAVTPGTANGSLITGADGAVIGSRQVAQAFAAPQYFWPRPSAVDYDGTGAGGSNLSPANPEIAERAEALIAAYGGASAENPIPADLVTASGAGLDPHISREGALFQVPRVAEARGVPPSEVRGIVNRLSARPGGFFTPERIVNVLELNLALDAELASDEAAE